MAFYSDEEEIWKCSTHPWSSTRRRHTGICPACLRDRLISLCPNCATARPCPCSCFPGPAFSSAGSISSSSSSSPFYDLLPSSSGLGIVGRVSNLIDNEPPFTRTRSTGINHFLTSRFGSKPIRLPLPENRRIMSRIWSVFRTQKIKEQDHDELARKEDTNHNYSRPDTPVMRRSTSLLYHVPMATSTSKSSTVVKPWKGRYFPSPMKVFRQHKTSKVVQEH